MTHFDFKTLLPALLQIEDRVSMAHGLESRVPFVDHAVVDFAATMPAERQVQERRAQARAAPGAGRRAAALDPRAQDKMGFPVPLRQWVGQGGPLHEYASDLLSSQAARSRPYLRDGFDPVTLLDSDTAYGRSLWGVLSLELWQRAFHDRAAEWRSRAPVAAAR